MIAGPLEYGACMGGGACVEEVVTDDVSLMGLC